MTGRDGYREEDRMTVIRWLHTRAGDLTNAALGGGKAAGLHFLASNGVRVPPCFAVTTEAFDLLLRYGLSEELEARAAEIPVDASLAELEDHAADIRRRVLDAPLPEGVAEEVTEAYEELCRTCRDHRTPVAVRSSASGEDAADTSFAGEHDTYLWVTGGAEVVGRVRDCWASLFTARAIDYRRHSGALPEGSMGVVVQQMVPARAAGVFMTLNPTNGDPSKIMVEAVWGLGEPLVQGAVNPDRWLLDKVTGHVVRREVETKLTRAVRDPVTGRGITTQEVPPELVDRPCLDDRELAELVRLARLIEDRAGRPQDGEFATSEGTPPDNVVVLQTRPETVWSKQRRTPVAGGKSALEAIVSKLTSAGSNWP